MFSLHQRLEADTAFVLDWELCRVLLMNDASYPWLILVPRREGVAELGDLSPADRAVAIEEIARASAALRGMTAAPRINVAALGNIVPQLHVHVIARFPDDPAWPGPVWGKTSPVAYDPETRDRLIADLRSALA